MNEEEKRDNLFKELLDIKIKQEERIKELEKKLQEEHEANLELAKNNLFFNARHIEFIHKIEKLQKENEELKDYKKLLDSTPKELLHKVFAINRGEFVNANDFVSKNKVIELKEEWNKGIYWNNADDRYYAVKGLEYLLKENNNE